MMKKIKKGKRQKEQKKVAILSEKIEENELRRQEAIYIRLPEEEGGEVSGHPPR